MFHQGDLQSGIGRAISEQKLVACFIRSDNEESQKWEQQWFGIGRRPAPIDIWALKAVFLRLEFGSQEAGFLNAFCPITSSPTLVVIDKGKVLEKIEAGIARDDFMVQLSKALDLEMHVVDKGEFEKAKQATQAHASASASAAAGPSTEAATSSTEEAAPTSPESARMPTAEASEARPSVPATHTQPGQSPAPSSTVSRSNAAASSKPTTDMSSLFPDRAQRHEVEAAKRAAAEKAERAARAKARRIEEEQALARDKGKGKATQETEKEKSRRDWIAQQKVRKDEAKRDKERILAQIEADKQERKARTQRAAAEAASESSPLPTSIDAASKRGMGAGGMCSLQVRLFDGTSIKGRFEPSATLDSTVREWIKTTTVDQGNVNAADVPFTFKQIISPLPSRSIEISEERQTLADLGLTPNATLVLVPIAGYTEAYSGNAGRGYMSSALHYTYALANGASSMLGSALSYVPGLSGPAATGSPTESHSQQSGAHSSDDSPPTLDGSSESAGSSRIKVKTLADQRAEADRQREKNPEFYNGNSSAFEGRKDDDHHKD
ncbi:putative UBX domain, Ubiquitin-like domain superfamily [Septoria linicola]|nr:putative UBX domain, Ubiquitin-like domain superfamily [Septoria linicola]